MDDDRKTNHLWQPAESCYNLFRMEYMSEKDRFKVLSEEVRDLSRYARKCQKDARKTMKDDGTPVTNVDMEISSSLIRTIGNLFPDANVVSEEHVTEYSSSRCWTFVIDPIDGTGVYTLGLPSYCTSVGILDSNKKAVGAFIAAPRFGLGEEELFVSYIPGSDVFVNGEKFVRKRKEEGLDEIMLSSRLGCYDLSSFDKKARVIGSSILQILLVSLSSGIKGSVTLPCYAWDLASAVAVSEKLGIENVYEDGTPLSFTEEMLEERKKSKGLVYTAEKGECKNLIALVRKANSSS